MLNILSSWENLPVPSLLFSLFKGQEASDGGFLPYCYQIIYRLPQLDG